MHLGINVTIQVNLLRVIGQVVAELSLLLQDLVHLGGVRGGIVAAAGGGSGHGQNGGEHKLRAEKWYTFSLLRAKCSKGEYHYSSSAHPVCQNS